MLLDRDDLARELHRLAAGRRAQIEDALAVAAADEEPRELRPAALRPDQSVGKRFLVDAPHVQRVGKLRVGLTFDPAGLAPVHPHHGLERLVLCRHQRQRVVAAELAEPELRHPVRVGVPQRGLLRRVVR